MTSQGNSHSASASLDAWAFLPLVGLVTFFPGVLAHIRVFVASRRNYFMKGNVPQKGVMSEW